MPSELMSRFSRGDHLRVHRRGVYWHHGIYVSDDRVIEFGGEKADAVVRAVTLTDFEGTDIAEVAPHKRRFLWGMGMPLPDPLPPEKIVRRAEWPLTKCKPARYNVAGSNCEHVANWCVTGHFESLQTRRIFAALPIVSLGLTAGWRWGGSKLVMRSIIVITAVSLGLNVAYQWSPYRFWSGIIEEWPGDNDDT